MSNQTEELTIEHEKLDCKECGGALSFFFIDGKTYLGCMCNIKYPVIGHATDYNKIFEKFLELRKKGQM